MKIVARTVVQWPEWELLMRRLGLSSVRFTTCQFHLDHRYNASVLMGGEPVSIGMTSKELYALPEFMALIERMGVAVGQVASLTIIVDMHDAVRFEVKAFATDTKAVIDVEAKEPWNGVIRTWTQEYKYETA